MNHVKSAMLRYFETREEIFLALAAEAWREWAAALQTQLGAGNPAEGIAHSLAARPLFGDLLAQAPLNLERNVSFEAVRDYKTSNLATLRPLVEELRARLGLTEQQAWDVISTATSMAGALWQMAAPGTALRAFYETNPDLAQAVIDVEPRLTRILTALLAGLQQDRRPESDGARTGKGTSGRGPRARAAGASHRRQPQAPATGASHRRQPQAPATGASQPRSERAFATRTRLHGVRTPTG